MSIIKTESATAVYLHANIFAILKYNSQGGIQGKILREVNGKIEFNLYTHCSYFTIFDLTCSHSYLLLLVVCSRYTNAIFMHKNTGKYIGRLFGIKNLGKYNLFYMSYSSYIIKG